MKIAIHQNQNEKPHATSWNNRWIEHCKLKNYDFEIIDCFQSNALDKLKDFDILLWHFGNYSHKGMLFARSLLNAAKQMGLKVFPDYATSWHFDDKIAQYFLLKSINAPIPASWVFFSERECLSWLEKEGKFPLVAKLRVGSGSNNVKLLTSYDDAQKYVHRMFGKGFENIPSVGFKAQSYINSAKNWKTFWTRLKRIPEFFQTRSKSKLLPRERGYAYFQAFIPNDGYDLRIVVIGDKLSYLQRNVRKGDFRASGSGSLFFDPTLVSKEIKNSAFQVCSKLRFQGMSFDYVIDNETGVGKIVEMSYSFPHRVSEAGGFWDKQDIWHSMPLNVPAEVVENLINS